MDLTYSSVPCCSYHSRVNHACTYQAAACFARCVSTATVHACYGSTCYQCTIRIMCHMAGARAVPLFMPCVVRCTVASIIFIFFFSCYYCHYCWQCFLSSTHLLSLVMTFHCVLFNDHSSWILNCATS
jgi:hypothetical protein